MKQIKGMQLGAMLAVILLVAVVFAGTIFQIRNSKVFRKIYQNVFTGIKRFRTSR